MTSNYYFFGYPLRALCFICLPVVRMNPDQFIVRAAHEYRDGASSHETNWRLTPPRL